MLRRNFYTSATIRNLGFALLSLLLGVRVALAQPLPNPPCGATVFPAFAEPGDTPRTGVWNAAQLELWNPPSCLGWMRQKDATLAVIAGSFRHTGTAQDLLRRFGEISRLRGLRYWSVSDKNWRVLVNDASATSAIDATRRRADYNLNELRPGMDLYFAQSDSRSSGEVLYRMRVKEASEKRMVVETENVSPVRLYLFTLFDAGELKAQYFIERGDAERWNIYTLALAVGRSARNNEASLLNRAAAYYRHYIGAPADAASPLAP
ncbi:MAG: DUF6675 family protein [Burkholderiales bacterium]